MRTARRPMAGVRGSGLACGAWPREPGTRLNLEAGVCAWQWLAGIREWHSGPRGGGGTAGLGTAQRAEGWLRGGTAGLTKGGDGTAGQRVAQRAWGGTVGQEVGVAQRA